MIDGDRRAPVRRLVLAVLVSRVVVFGAALVAERWGPPVPAWMPPTGDHAPFLSSLTAWDGWWYLRIAGDGYHLAPGFSDYHDYVFFPLYPILVRALTVAVPAWSALVAVLFSNALFLVATVLVARLGETVLGAERGWRAAALLAISPFAAVFSMAYPESLFLCLAAGALLAMERDRRRLAGVLGLLAGLARLQGALLAIPLAILAISRDRGVRPSTAWTLLPPVGSLAFLAFVGQLTGDPLGYLHAEAAWGRGGGGVDASVAGVAAGVGVLGSLSLFDWLPLGLLLFSVFLLVYFRNDRIPWAYRAIAFLGLGLPLASGSLQSVGRYLLPAFPFDWVLAGPRARWFRLAWPPVSLVLLAVVAYGIFTRQLVP